MKKQLQSTVTSERNKNGFFKALWTEAQNLLKNPKKLIPTFALCGIWLVFSLMSGFGVNLPIFRFLYTLTYANGGMLGGFFGTVGGIFGKAVFAAVVNSVVLSICAKENPFSGLQKKMKGIFTGSIFALAPLFIGGGLGVLLYWFFNITSSPVNCAVAVVAAVGTLSSMSKKNGLLFSLIFGAMSKLSGGKTPSVTTVNRVITGFSLGFAVSFPITFARYPLVLFLVGLVLLVAGIVLVFVGKNTAKKIAATTALILMIGASLMPVFAVNVSAASDSYYIVIDPFYKENKETYGYHYNDWDQWMYYSFYQAGKIELENISDGKYSFALPGYDYSFTDADTDYSVVIPDVEFIGEINKDPDNETGYHAEFSAKLEGGISTSLISTHDSQTRTYIHDMKEFTLRLSFSTKKEQNGGLKVNSSDSRCVRRNYPEGTENPDTYTYWSEQASHFSQGFTLYNFYGNVSPASSGGDEDTHDSDYIPYRGRLTYNNGRTNKYGQPFPDLMDFDMDGDIDYADRVLQHELVHNPDYLDQPGSPAAIVAIAILTVLLGGGGAIVGAATVGAVGSAAAEVLGGTVAEAAGETVGSAVSGVDDLGPHISQDSDGDLNVTDPATGEKRLYKNNGDGTYTNPMTGATYTESELRSSLESRADNAGTIRQDAAEAEEAIASQRSDNQGLSQSTKDYEAEKAKQAAHDEYVEKLGEKYGVNSGDEDDIRAKIGYEQGKAEIESYEYQELEGEYKNKQKYVETVEKVADTSIDVLADVTGRKDIKAGYTMLKNTAARTTEAYVNDKNVMVGMAQGAIEGGIGVVQDNVDGAGAKLVANVVGETYKEAMDATINGKNMTEAVMGGIGKGLVNTGVDVGMDLVGDGVKGMMGDAADDALKNALTEGAEVTKGSIVDGAKTLTNDLIKGGLDEAFKMPGED